MIFLEIGETNTGREISPSMSMTFKLGSAYARRPATTDPEKLLSEGLGDEERSTAYLRDHHRRR